MYICRVCENANNNDTISVKQTGTNYLDEFDYIKCNKCNSLTIREVPKNLSSYYEDYYSLKPFPHIKYSRSNSYLRRLWLSRFHKIGKWFFPKTHPLDLLALQSVLFLGISSESKILDVGSGTGKFVYDLHNLGYTQAIGIDPFIKENLKYENGTKIYRRELSEISDQYELITFHHTLEHLPDLDVCLKLVKRILAPYGCCVIRIPNISSYSAIKFGRYWTGIHAPYHLILPSYEVLINNVFPRNGLKLRMMKGEQLYHFFLSNMDNAFNLITDGSKMFREFASIHTQKDIRHFRQLAKTIRSTPHLCEWVNYYVMHDKSI